MCVFLVELEASKADLEWRPLKWLPLLREQLLEPAAPLWTGAAFSILEQSFPSQAPGGNLSLTISCLSPEAHQV